MWFCYYCIKSLDYAIMYYNISIKYMVCISTKYFNAWILIKTFFLGDIFLLNTLDNIIPSLIKISFIWCDKFICNFKYIYINEIIFIKKIIIGVGWGKLTRSRVLRGPKGQKWGKEICPSCGAGDKTKPYGTKVKTPFLGPTPTPLSVEVWTKKNGVK